MSKSSLTETLHIKNERLPSRGTGAFTGGRSPSDSVTRSAQQGSQGCQGVPRVSSVGMRDPAAEKLDPGYQQAGRPFTQVSRCLLCPCKAKSIAVFNSCIASSNTLQNPRSTLWHWLQPAPSAGLVMVGPTRNGSNRVFYMKLWRLIWYAVPQDESTFNLKLKCELILYLPYSAFLEIDSILKAWKTCKSNS